MPCIWVTWKEGKNDELISEDEIQEEYSIYESETETETETETEGEDENSPNRLDQITVAVNNCFGLVGFKGNKSSN